MLDMMHIWQLGCLRDLLGSTIKLLVRRRGIYAGSRLALRLITFNRELREFVREKNLPLSAKRIKKQSLNWKQDCYPVLGAKAADCSTILQFVNDKLQRPGVQIEDYPGLTACVWAAAVFSGCLMSGQMMLTDAERETVLFAGRMYLETYMTLANQAMDNSDRYFKVRPKLHYLQHLIEDVAVHPKNPASHATFMEEDFIRHALTMKRSMSHRTSCLNILKRFCVVTKGALDKHLQPGR